MERRTRARNAAGLDRQGFLDVLLIAAAMVVLMVLTAAA